MKKRDTLEVAEAMPEADYSFKPVDEEMTFGEQMWRLKGIKPPKYVGW